MLSHDELLSYLRERGALSNESIVEGEVVLEDATRRNQNFVMWATHGSPLFIKVGLDREKAATLAREASVYRALGADDRERNRFGEYLVRYSDFDEENSILIIQLLRGAQNLRECAASQGPNLPTVAAQIGEALATLHGVDAGEPFVECDPWILRIHRPRHAMLATVSESNLQLMRVIQSYPGLCDALDALKRVWTRATVIHFDIRWENILLSAVPGDEPAIKIVDWELAGIGDPGWDVGSVFHEYLAAWLDSLPMTADLHLDQMIDCASCPLEEMQPAMRAFWESYVGTMNLDRESSEQRLTAAVKFAGARLLLSAFEQMQWSTVLTGTALARLQLCLNTLQRPREASAHLLGIGFS